MSIHRPAAHPSLAFFNRTADRFRQRLPLSPPSGFEREERETLKPSASKRRTAGKERMDAHLSQSQGESYRAVLKEEPTSPRGQCELALAWRPSRPSFRLRANDVVRVDGRLGRVIRVTECVAVVLLNRPVREFTTRFDQRVRIQPSPVLVRISANSEMEILNRRPKKKRRERRLTLPRPA